MNFRQTKVKLVILGSVLMLAFPGASCVSASQFDAQVGSIVKPYSFSIVGWEFETVPREVYKGLSGSQEHTDDEVGVVLEYFSSVARINALSSEMGAITSGNHQGTAVPLEDEFNRLCEQTTALEDKVERIIEKQIKATLTEQGIFNPLDKLKINFPPLNFNLERPPYLLVISPRDRIESLRRIILRPDLSLKAMEDIETNVDQLDVSSLVVELGGFGGIYPSFVGNNGSLRFTIDTATEEWLHQYLAFTPLGFRYLLDSIGVSQGYDIITMNETLAGIVSKEIGAMVYKRYYASRETGVTHDQSVSTESEFTREMREIRRTVDKYLAQGEIELAEKFMEQKRQNLASNGYYLRKLNQAYFAFYGTYADAPTSISPIGLKLKALRSQSASLKDFLNTVAVMTNTQELKQRG